MELEWINRLRERPESGYLGDDAAVFGDQLLTVDMLTEGVDFLLDQTEPERIGRKALAVNLSDIAAMGGTPTAVLVSLALPVPVEPDGDRRSLELAERLYGGMRPLLERYRVALIGGDTNRWHGGLVLSITALGRIAPKGPLRRSGGKSGDVLLVTGPLGGSITEHQFLFEPRVWEASYLNEHHEIHAAIDLSDGLSLDLHRLAWESGLGAVLDETLIPITDEACRLSERDGRSPLKHALADGEDFELLLAVPAPEADRLLKTQPLRERFGTTLYRVGVLTEKKEFLLRDCQGKLAPLAPEGFEH